MVGCTMLRRESDLEVLVDIFSELNRETVIIVSLIDFFIDDLDQTIIIILFRNDIENITELIDLINDLLCQFRNQLAAGLIL